MTKKLGRMERELCHSGLIRYLELYTLMLKILKCVFKIFEP